MRKANGCVICGDTKTKYYSTLNGLYCINCAIDKLAPKSKKEKYNDNKNDK